MQKKKNPEGAQSSPGSLQRRNRGGQKKKTHTGSPGGVEKTIKMGLWKEKTQIDT